MKLCAEFSDPAAVIIKHTNPCGAAIAPEGEGVLAAYRRARETDPVSAFGGIVAVNRLVDAELAKEMAETFLECIVAPDFSPEALALLSVKKGLRLLQAARSARRSPQRARAAQRGWRGAGAEPRRRHQRGGRSVGQGGHPARAHRRRAARPRLRLARGQAREVERHRVRRRRPHAGHRRRPDVPGRFGAHRRGQGPRRRWRVRCWPPTRSSRSATGWTRRPRRASAAIVEPGGSVRDQEVIAAADERDIAMVFTGERHFRH